MPNALIHRCVNKRVQQEIKKFKDETNILKEYINILETINLDNIKKSLLII